jgi:uncharacterized membrane protein
MEHPPGIVVILLLVLAVLLIFGAGTMVYVWMSRPAEAREGPWLNLVMGAVAVLTVIGATALALIAVTNLLLH